MGELLLIGVLALTVFVVFILIKRMEELLGAKPSGSMEKEKDKENRLRIAAENPDMLDAVSDMLRQFSERHEDCPLDLFTGGVDEIFARMEEHSIDLGLVGSDCHPAANFVHETKLLSCKRGSVISDTLGLSVEPLSGNCGRIKMVWNPDGLSFLACELIRLRDRTEIHS